MPSRRSATPRRRPSRPIRQRRSRPPRPRRPVYHEVVTEREIPVAPAPAEPGAYSFVVLDEVPGGFAEPDPAAIVLTCANCGARMDERKCKLICSCGYFASCSDYY